MRTPGSEMAHASLPLCDRQSKHNRQNARQFIGRMSKHLHKYGQRSKSGNERVRADAPGLRGVASDGPRGSCLESISGEFGLFVDATPVAAPNGPPLGDAAV
jgi:hypothetical protein